MAVPTATPRIPITNSVVENPFHPVLLYIDISLLNLLFIFYRSNPNAFFGTSIATLQSATKRIISTHLDIVSVTQ